MSRRWFNLMESRSNPEISLDEIKNRRFDTGEPVAQPNLLDKSLQQILSIIDEEFPEIGDVLWKAKADGQGEASTFEALVQVMQDHPEMAARLTEVASTVMAPLRAESDILKPKTPEGPGILFDTLVGLPRLNPLYEAALIERIQFDGDVPEARTGPLAKGIEPAVPVQTRARNPVAVGMMLKAASALVLDEVKESRQGIIDHVDHLVASDHPTAMILSEHPTSLTAIANGSADTDPASYRRGQVPALIQVQEPSGGALSALSRTEQKEAAWKCLSTTQGRRSMAETIWEGIASRLRKAGFQLSDYAPPSKDEEPPQIRAYSEWTYPLDGPNSTQANFAYIDVAIAVMVAKLIPQVTGPNPELRLDVFSINTMAKRVVGWGSRLVVL